MWVLLMCAAMKMGNWGEIPSCVTIQMASSEACVQAVQQAVAKELRGIYRCINTETGDVLTRDDLTDKERR